MRICILGMLITLCVGCVYGNANDDTREETPVEMVGIGEEYSCDDFFYWVEDNCGEELSSYWQYGVAEGYYSDAECSYLLKEMQEYGCYYRYFGKELYGGLPRTAC